MAMEKAMSRDGIATNDRQLACARIQSEEGHNYLGAMAAAANYAWVNRSSMTFLTRQAFAKVFDKSPNDLDMHLIYDVRAPCLTAIASAHFSPPFRSHTT